MDFPILDLMDETACYQFLLNTLHPEGLRGPTCRRADALTVHDRHRPPVFDSRCRLCGVVFNADTGTPLQKTHRTPAQLVLILRGIWQGTPTAQLAWELGCDRQTPARTAAQTASLGGDDGGGDGASRRTGNRSGRDVSECGGKKGTRISTPTTRRVVGPTNGAATVRSPMTARRWSGW